MKTKARTEHHCLYCGRYGYGNFCSHCGKQFVPSPITVKSIVHDVLHLYTKLDSGFMYTLKKLATAPGYMQWDYLHGLRYKYQKPFSMLFICGSVAAIIRFFVYQLTNTNGQPGITEALFYREYWILLHLVLMPLYVFIIYLFFKNCHYNYAETGVVVMYLFSFLFLISGFAALFKFLFPNIDTVYIELPFSFIFVPLTFIRFFKKSRRWVSFFKSIIILLLIFIIVQITEQTAYDFFKLKK